MSEFTMQREPLVDHLNALIELDLDAIEAYEAAIARLKDPGDRARLEGFLRDHRRHVTDLTILVEQRGAVAASHPDFKRVLTKGKVVLAGVAGDRAVLEAMRSNETTTTKTYEKAARDPSLPADARMVVERNFADEARHYAWIDQRLGRASAAHLTR